jgi:hypothetical protein
LLPEQTAELDETHEQLGIDRWLLNPREAAAACRQEAALVVPRYIAADLSPLRTESARLADDRFALPAT